MAGWDGAVPEVSGYNAPRGPGGARVIGAAWEDEPPAQPAGGEDVTATTGAEARQEESA